MALLASAVLVAVQLGLLVWTHTRTDEGRIIARAVNAGVPIGSDDGRVFAYPVGHRDQVAGQAPVNGPLRAPPGRYDLRVVYTRSRDQQQRWIEDVALGAGETIERQVEFSAGQLKVAASGGRAGARDTKTVVYVFKPDDHDTIVTAIAAGERAVLGAGDYDVRVVLTRGSEEKGVKWLRQISVRPGLATERTVAFERGHLRVRALNAGEELPPTAVALTLYAAGDVQAEIRERGAAGVPLDVPTGRYDVRAVFVGSNDQSERWIKAVMIGDDETVERTIEFSSGTALVRAAIEGGEELAGFQVYLYYYPTGDHEKPVAYVPAGQPVVLASGTYDVRAQFFRSADRPEIWRPRIVVSPGKTFSETIRFQSGRVLIRAYEPGGNELVGDNVFVEVFAAGEHRRPLVVGRSGEELQLAAGRYDLRARDSREPQNDAWISDLAVGSGRLLERSVVFRAPGQRGAGRD